ncbi:MAG: YciC family protein [Candidatus Thermoplasmatota archaeon]|nr:YciC family protein [Candidatus Thermoplasmatota archaeon]
MPSGHEKNLAPPGIQNALRQGWNAMTDNFLVLLGITLLYFLAQFVGGMFNPTLAPGEIPSATESLRFGLGGLYNLLVLAPLLVGACWAFLHAVRAEPVALKDLGAGFSIYLAAVAGMFLMSLAIGIGFVLLVVPGVILAVRLAFTPFILVDQHAGPVEALKASWEATRGYGWSIFGLMLSSLGILFVGLLLLGIGVIPAWMWVVGAFAAYYHDVVDRPPAPATSGAATTPHPTGV